MNIRASSKLDSMPIGLIDLNTAFRTSERSPHFRLCSYKLDDSILQSHLKLVNSKQGRATTYASRSSTIESLRAWVEESLQSPKFLLYSIYMDEEFVGTSRVCLSSDSFSIGILVSDSAAGFGLDIAVKGSLMSHLFLSSALGKCTGGCYKDNIKSLSFYKYFRFNVVPTLPDEINQHRPAVSFELSHKEFLEWVERKLSKRLTEFGFDSSDFQSAGWIKRDMVDLPSYSSLTYFNMASHILKIKPELDIMDIFECANFAKIVDLLSASLPYFFDSHIVV